MPILKQAPTEAHLRRLYFELASLGAPSVGSRSRWPYRPNSTEELLALAGAMLRYDPRLLSILLQFVVEHEAGLNPRALRAAMADMQYPQALLVVFWFAKAASNAPEIAHMAEYLAQGIGPVSPPERFFIDTDRPGSRQASRKMGRNLRAYARWGFIGTERPTADAYRKTTVGSYDARTREDIARSTARRRGKITLAQYLQAIDHSVSRAQAREDLRKAGLRLVGKGRGAHWVLE